MARKTITEQITYLEARRDNLETKIEKHESFKSLEAQGSSGAKTEFVDPARLHDQLELVNNKLSILYRSQGL